MASEARGEANEPGEANEASELVVVPAERHVERVFREGREGRRAETRSSLRSRLSAALLGDVRFADRTETRLTLAVALTRPAKTAQLDLFAAAAASAGGAGQGDPLIATLRARGGASWVRAVAALDDALGALRARGATESLLERVRGGGVSGARARTLATAMRALDAALAEGGARDGRLLGRSLAPAIRATPPASLVELVGARAVRARWLLAWEPDDLAWWRALDETLARAGGAARIVLPTFDQRLEGTRARDPLDVLADVVARQLDAAPETEPIPPVLGDLASTPPDAPRAAGRVRLVRALGVRDEARVVARLVRQALDGGAAVERIALAYTTRDERTLGPLRRALEAERIVFHDALGAPPSSVAVVAAALHALDAQESLDRVAVARLLRSGYVDAPRLLTSGPGSPDAGASGERPSFRDAERVLVRLARSLASRATAAGADAGERLVSTAAERGSGDEAAARRVADVLLRGRSAKTRGERARGARALFQELGLASRAGRGALATFAKDEAPAGVDRAERLAVARDVRAWEILEGALDAYETTAARIGALDLATDAEVFRLELGELLEASAALPGGGRAGAVRLARLADVAGDELDLLVVLDANDGTLPRDVRPVTLVSEALEQALERSAARDARGAAGGNGANDGEFVPGDASELAARDLAALATCAAEAAHVVLVTTVEDGTDAPASPARVVRALERAGVALEIGDGGPVVRDEEAASLEGSGSVLQLAGEVSRRATREAQREAFFLDPARPVSDVIGDLGASPTGGPTSPLATLATLVLGETGGTAQRPLAVTSLERFAQCPFKGYAHVVLAARKDEEQRELPDAREEGNLGHDALAAAFTATASEWPRRPRDRDGVLARGLAAAEKVLVESAGHAPLRAVVRLRVRESVTAVLGRALDEEEWDFVYAERAFGNAKPWPAFEVLAGPSPATDVLWLRGSIDRVDRAHVGAAARVIDYKRSKTTVKSSSSGLGETALQVPIYAAVAGRALEASATGLYLPIQPKDLADETRARASVEDRVSDLARPLPTGAKGGSAIERRALAVVVSARAGHFAPIPAKESECTHCEYSGGCRKPRFAMAPSDEADDRGAGGPA